MGGPKEWSRWRRVEGGGRVARVWGLVGGYGGRGVGGGGGRSGGNKNVRAERWIRTQDHTNTSWALYPLDHRTGWRVMLSGEGVMRRGGAAQRERLVTGWPCRLLPPPHPPGSPPAPPPLPPAPPAGPAAAPSHLTLLGVGTQAQLSALPCTSGHGPCPVGCDWWPAPAGHVPVCAAKFKEE